MQTIAISVPVGAWHPFLESALASLRCQGPGIAVALLDASGDPRVKEIGDQNSDWLSYRRHGPDGGQSDAILEGWKNLEGDWLGWLNADDILMPGMLDRMRAAHADDPSLEVIYGHSTILDETGAMTGYHFNVEPPGPRLLQAGIISQPSCLFSRAAYERAGGLDPDLHYTMDWDLWIRLYKEGARFGFVDEPLSMVLWAAGTKTASLNKRRREELKTIIARHAPQGVHKEVFRDFAIHAMIDMIWPDALRQRIIRKLRGAGPSVYGIRADGHVGKGMTVMLAHYGAGAKPGVSLQFDRVPEHLEIVTSIAQSKVEQVGERVDIMLTEPVQAGQPFRVTVRRSGDDPLYFRRAEWLA